jgi:hypothetical protein
MDLPNEFQTTQKNSSDEPTAATELSIPERLARAEQAIGGLAKLLNSGQSADLSALAAMAPKIRHVIEKYFPHDDPSPVVARKAPATPQFVPALDAGGHQMVDPATGWPIFKPQLPI